MADLIRFAPPYVKDIERKNVVFEPWLIEGSQGVSAIREKLQELAGSECALLLDLSGAELAPESIAAIFFFALEHQDRFGVLQVTNLGRQSYALLRGMRADEMPMVKFSPAANGGVYSLN